MLDVYYIQTTIDGEPYDYMALRVRNTNVVISYDDVLGDDAYIVLDKYWETDNDWNVTYIGRY